MRKAILVLAPESSGGRLAARCVAACGVEGEPSFLQPFDNSLDGAGDLILWRKSLPDGMHSDRGWPDMEDMVAQLREKDYDINVLCVLRNQYCAARSQVTRGMVTCVEDAGHNISEAMRRVGNLARRQHLWCVWTTYETIIHNWPVFRMQLAEMGLDAPVEPPEQLIDGNAKYLESCTA